MDSLLSAQKAGYRSTEVAGNRSDALKWGAAAGTAMGVIVYAMASYSATSVNSASTLVSAAGLKPVQGVQTLAPSVSFGRVASSRSAPIAAGARPVVVSDSVGAYSYETAVEQPASTEVCRVLHLCTPPWC